MLADITPINTNIPRAILIDPCLRISIGGELMRASRLKPDVSPPMTTALTGTAGYVSNFNGRWRMYNEASYLPSTSGCRGR
jgi:hypothetical protein